MRVIVFGGRDFTDYSGLCGVLENLPIKTLVHGRARGADRMAGQWALARGVPCEEFPADWENEGRAAGIIRNKRMAAAGADLGVAFPGGRGTAHMISTCHAAGIPVLEITRADLHDRCLEGLL